MKNLHLYLLVALFGFGCGRTENNNRFMEEEGKNCSCFSNCIPSLCKSKRNDATNKISTNANTQIINSSAKKTQANNDETIPDAKDESNIEVKAINDIKTNNSLDTKISDNHWITDDKGDSNIEDIDIDNIKTNNSLDTQENNYETIPKDKDKETEIIEDEIIANENDEKGEILKTKRDDIIKKKYVSLDENIYKVKKNDKQRYILHPIKTSTEEKTENLKTIPLTDELLDKIYTENKTKLNKWRQVAKDDPTTNIRKKLYRNLKYSDIKKYYEKYKERLRMDDKNVKYILDEKSVNVKAWKSKLKSYGAKHFPDEFIKATKHIDFETFFKKITEIAEEIWALYKKKENKYQQIALSVGGVDCSCGYKLGNLNKSNAWVFLLLFGELSKILEDDEKIPYPERDNIFKFFDEPYEVYEYNKDNYKSNEEIPKTLCVVCDDMSYSGTQITKSLDKCGDGFGISEKIDLYFGLPFIGETAKNKGLQSSFLETNIKPKYFKATKEVYSFETLWKGDAEILEEVKRINNKKVFNLNMIPVYFDFKIPDTVSVPYHIWMLGCNPFNWKNENLKTLKPLISNYTLKPTFRTRFMKFSYLPKKAF